MPAFVAFDIARRDLVLQRVKEHYPNDHFDPGSGAIFIFSANETPQQVAAKIGLSKQSATAWTSGVVVAIQSYWGHYNRNLWNWLNDKA